VAIPRLAVGFSLLAATLLVGAHGHAESAAQTGHAAVRSAPAGDVTSGTSVVFPYRQRRLMYSRNPSGGLAYVTSGAPRGVPLPVVVFLHGMNPSELIHPWFGPPYGDLRPVLDALVSSGKVAPFVVAAPTHTRFATGSTVMWPRFELGDFLDATEAALGQTAKLDRARIIVVGHSAAACSATGGIFADSVRRAKPLAIVDVDGCANEPITSALAQASRASPVHFFWQRTWARPISELERACPACKVEEISDLDAAASAHVAILPEALRRVLPQVLPPEPSQALSSADHDGG
jgi:hypothetical protein